ncbi:flagellar hook-length control protein [Mycobacterium marinum]|uniref:flagellar hook-length control protein n=1 Tax=Mycobacterium marinum TaxID=1781 RepID=UPI0035658E67
MTATTSDVITAAMSIASEAADGRLDPAALQATAVAECRELFGTVVGDGDALWSLHAEVARQAIALGALSADELSEWAAVMRRRAGETVEPPAPPVDLLPPDSAASDGESQPELTDDDGETDAVALQGASVVTALAALASAAQQAHATPAPQRRADEYDPLAGWEAGGSRRP